MGRVEDVRALLREMTTEERAVISRELSDWWTTEQVCQYTGQAPDSLHTWLSRRGIRRVHMAPAQAVREALARSREQGQGYRSDLHR